MREDNMADRSLSAFELSSNDVISLAQIIESNLKYHRTHFSFCEERYLKALKAAIGLGFAAVIVDGKLTDTYQYKLDKFLKCQKKYRNIHMPPEISTTIAEMISLAESSFLSLNHPKYYSDFKKSVSYILDNAIAMRSRILMPKVD